MKISDSVKLTTKLDGDPSLINLTEGFCLVLKNAPNHEEVILMDRQNNQKLEIPQDIKAFLEGILKDANMTSLDSAMHEEMINELFARLDNFITSVIVDALPAGNLDEFIKMNEEKRPKEEIESYMREHVPNVQDVMARAFMDFRDMYLRNVTVARNAPESDQKESLQKGAVN